MQHEPLAVADLYNEGDSARVILLSSNKYIVAKVEWRKYSMYKYNRIFLNRGATSFFFFQVFDNLYFSNFCIILHVAI